MKVADLYNAKDSLERLSRIDLPIRASFKVVRLIEKFNKELAITEPLRQKLFEKYGDKDGDALKIKPENQFVFQQEWNDLLSTEIRFDFTPIRLEEFGEDAKIQPLDLFNLQNFIEQEIPD